MSLQADMEGSRTKPVKFNNQDYIELKNEHLNKNTLFVDSTFPPNGCSLGDLPYLDQWDEDHLTWLRPAEVMQLQGIEEEISFCKDAGSRLGFIRGFINNSWFLASLSSLTFNHSMMEQVVPMNQSFLDYEYAGIFHFRFWRFGKWVDVVIDDFLPVYNHGLISVHSLKENEFWGALVEKAYAKLCGSYAALNFASPSEASRDFTGGVSIDYFLGSENDLDQLWLSLKRATDTMSLVCCGTPQGEEEFDNSVNSNGLLNKHAYCITAVTEITHLDAKVRLVRIFNPWGKLEWNGKWSDESELWDSVSAEDKQKKRSSEDGEFWMQLEDFCEFFSFLNISSENLNFIDGDLDSKWNTLAFDGSWVAGKSAGGAMQGVSFETNPQYRIQVGSVDDMKPGDYNLMISLVQKPSNRRFTRYYPVAVLIAKVPTGTPEGMLELPFFYKNKPLKIFDYYCLKRELVELYNVEPGEYVIVPHTKMIHQSADYLLTVHTKAEANMSVWEKHYAPKQKPMGPVVSTDDEEAFNALFKRYAENDELDKVQLQKVLCENFPHGSMDGFSSDVCRSLSALVNEDEKMSVTITEFRAMWEKMMEYKKIFETQDLSGNGTLSEYELKTAVESIGVDVDNSSVKRLMYRYSDKNSTSLRDFIILMIHLEKIIKKNAKDGKIEVSAEEWNKMTMYNSLTQNSSSLSLLDETLLLENCKV